jgi:hypothetical protein
VQPACRRFNFGGERFAFRPLPTHSPRPRAPITLHTNKPATKCYTLLGGRGAGVGLGVGGTRLGT